MRMIGKAGKAAAIAAIAALALTACGRAEPGTTSGTTGAAGFAQDSAIGVALPKKTSENWVLAEKLFNDGLTSAGFKPTVQFANNGVAEQQNQISAMIAKGAKVIIVGALDGSQLGAVDRSHNDDLGTLGDHGTDLVLLLGHAAVGELDVGLESGAREAVVEQLLREDPVLTGLLRKCDADHRVLGERFPASSAAA